ncbi:MAG: hypothetical protein H0U53_07945 [Actinobacteria bacterium]|nr:hypothetical protein [Actinomycetota bacterium]
MQLFTNHPDEAAQLRPTPPSVRRPGAGGKFIAMARERTRLGARQTTILARGGTMPLNLAA